MGTSSGKMDMSHWMSLEKLDNITHASSLFCVTALVGLVCQIKSVAYIADDVGDAKVWIVALVCVDVHVARRPQCAIPEETVRRGVGDRGTG